MVFKKPQFYYLVFITLFSLFFISACQQEESISVLQEPAPSQERNASSNGIQFTLTKTEFESSPSTISTVIKNTTNHSCSYGDFFGIELNQTGLWYQISFSEEVFQKYPDFIDIGLILDANDTTSQNFSLERLNMTLPQGEYRLTKTLLCPSPQGKEITLSGPFKIG
ncbi:immunoglobulin-like domain-containing protein [Aquibacillus saliphilus]|uniref:immunoglobulin-like domain-containing protein n=1 Tax=Aquibacillus saliphilus TaxID=1909422 RepID=UPI001CF0614C|nr:immunoglobulin-like domain-containing protein [Aquibacillus saliphilus]